MCAGIQTAVKAHVRLEVTVSGRKRLHGNSRQISRKEHELSNYYYTKQRPY